MAVTNLNKINGRKEIISVNSLDVLSYRMSDINGFNLTKFDLIIN